MSSWCYLLMGIPKGRGRVRYVSFWRAKGGVLWSANIVYLPLTYILLFSDLRTTQDARDDEMDEGLTRDEMVYNLHPDLMEESRRSYSSKVAADKGRCHSCGWLHCG